MEDIDIGLEKTVVETSPDFDESPQEPPKRKLDDGRVPLRRNRNI